MLYGFIADFYCHPAALVVECDGPIHDPEADAERDDALSRRGFLTLRFSNQEVLQDIERVVERIAAAARERIKQFGTVDGEKADARLL